MLPFQSIDALLLSRTRIFIEKYTFLQFMTKINKLPSKEMSLKIQHFLSYKIQNTNIIQSLSSNQITTKNFQIKSMMMTTKLSYINYN